MVQRQILANAIRFLSMDAVQQAKSGHPGMPMGMADIAEVLWNDFLSHNPNNPNWLNRDRFVVSNGHGSMLHYAMLHLAGYDLPMSELKQFRQLHSKTAGHPEHGITPGVETTTGPLGQGITNAVGMAMAEKILAAQFNQTDFPIIDHHTYVFLGDGCLMEGISHEACSLAGTLELGKLIAFWDDNGISIDGKVEGWFTDNTPERFRSYHWHVIDNVDGHDAMAVKAAIDAAKKITDKPTLICCKTTIGYGSPKLAGTHNSHGAPLGDDEIAATRKALNWSHKPFEIPDDIYQAWDAKQKGGDAERTWNELLARYQQAHPELAQQLLRRLKGELPTNWQETTAALFDTIIENPVNKATRQASQECLNNYTKALPEMLGGSADLTGSNGTKAKDATVLTRDNFDANYIQYGVREFAMSAIMNGMALYGGFIPYGGTFLVFTDYARNAVRMAALMKQRVVFVYTHDSIGLGEDGPTHQPVEHAAMLRLTPNMDVWRPCDRLETAVAWQSAIERCDGPASLLLTRQSLPEQARNQDSVTQIQRGAYILHDTTTSPDVILLATGSEVELAMQAATQLEKDDIAVRVVSMPCVELFERQDDAYREQVLPSHLTKRVAVEMGIADYWYKYVGLQGKVVGMTSFGDSAPAEELFKYFGFTVDNVVTTVKSVVALENM